jgi:hypothetical protein
VSFNLKEYEPVEDRNRRFWADHPEGRILTDLVHHDGTRYVVRSEVYTDRDDTRPAATGYAEEVVTAVGVNKTSALENCETSAEGRALARLGYAPKGARPSREEMEKVQRRETPSPADEARQRLLVLCEDLNIKPLHVAGAYAEQYETAIGNETDAAKIEAFITSVKADPDSVLPKVDA